MTELYKTKYLPAHSKRHHSNNDQTDSTTSTENVQPSLFGDLFDKQMRNFQKVATDDDLKRYLSEGVVDPDMLVKERTGINGVLGWWKVTQALFQIKWTPNKNSLRLFHRFTKRNFQYSLQWQKIS